MYDINVKNVRKGNNIMYIFLLVGIIFFVILLLVYLSDQNIAKKLDSETLSTKVEINTSENSDGNTMYSPTYYYEIDGKEYKCSSNSSSSNNPGTKNKKVYYSSKDPSLCMTAYSKSSDNILLFVLIIPIIFIIVGVLNIVKNTKRIKTIKELNNRGKLIKNLPYRLENTGVEVNGNPIQRPVVDYTLPSGTVLTLKGDGRYDGKISDADGLIDLIIDENNPNIYFMDFEINRLSGNLPGDYYQGNTAQTVQQPQPVQTSAPQQPQVQQPTNTNLQQLYQDQQNNNQGNV